MGPHSNSDYASCFSKGGGTELCFAAEQWGAQPWPKPSKQSLSVMAWLVALVNNEKLITNGLVKADVENRLEKRETLSWKKFQDPAGIWIWNLLISSQKNPYCQNLIILTANNFIVQPQNLLYAKWGGITYTNLGIVHLHEIWFRIVNLDWLVNNCAANTWL